MADGVWSQQLQQLPLGRRHVWDNVLRQLIFFFCLNLKDNMNITYPDPDVVAQQHSFDDYYYYAFLIVMFVFQFMLLMFFTSLRLSHAAGSSCPSQ